MKDVLSFNIILALKTGKSSACAELNKHKHHEVLWGSGGIAPLFLILVLDGG
jgi:hypothetical protein